MHYRGVTGGNYAFKTNQHVFSWLWIPVAMSYFIFLFVARLVRIILCGPVFSDGTVVLNNNSNDRRGYKKVLEGKSNQAGSITNQPKRSMWILEPKFGFILLFIFGVATALVTIFGFNVRLERLGIVVGLLVASILGFLIGCFQRLITGIGFGIGFGMGLVFALSNTMNDVAELVDITNLTLVFFTGPLISQVSIQYPSSLVTNIRLYNTTAIMRQVIEFSYDVQAEANSQLITR